MTPESVTELEPQPQGMSEASRLSGVFFEPKKAFEDIAARPFFWVPLILTIVAGLIFVTILGQHVGWSQVMRQQMQANSRSAQQMEQMPPEQRERMIEMQTRFVPFGFYAGALIGGPIFFLISGLILLGITRGIMSAPIRFKQVFAILCYASVPAIIQTILTIAVMFLKKPEEFNLQNPLAFNPGAFMDPTTTSKFLYAVASAIDVFTIWRILLIAVGLKAAGGRKLSFGGALTAVLLPWIVIVLIRGALAGVFG